MSMVTSHTNLRQQYTRSAYMQCSCASVPKIKRQSQKKCNIHDDKRSYQKWGTKRTNRQTTRGRERWLAKEIASSDIQWRNAITHFSSRYKLNSCTHFERNMQSNECIMSSCIHTRTCVPVWGARSCVCVCVSEVHRLENEHQLSYWKHNKVASCNALMQTLMELPQLMQRFCCVKWSNLFNWF